METTEYISLRSAAESLNVRDIFVLRRVEEDRFVHVGGVGRGEGWAGLIELRLRNNGKAREAYDGNSVTEVVSNREVNVFGPYWSRWAAFVPVDQDVMVVFGGLASSEHRVDTVSLSQAALAAARDIRVVSPAKRLADELEILHAVQNLMAAEPDSSVEAMQHIVNRATEALSCEYGIVWLRDLDTYAVCERGWQPGMSPVRTAKLLRSSIRNKEEAPVCVQDASRRPLPAPFLSTHGVCAYYLLPLGRLAMLLLVHTHHDSRGFTSLCQELGRRLAESSEILLRATIQKESLARELERVSGEARRDALTGLGNRLAWTERLDSKATEKAMQETGVLYIDLDNLKHINDELGHEAGDHVLQAIADILRKHMRPQDFVARLGGDEFAALLPNADANACKNIVERLNAAAAAHPGIKGYPIRFTYGFSVCKPGDSLHDALREADANLIREKQSRQA
jgi:diguanylate cyclase (GGDEF)-like protein